MAKSVKPLSDVELKRAKSKDKQYKLYDGGGLFLIVRPNGKKVFKVRYKVNGKDTEKTLGEYPMLTLGEARKKVLELKKLLSDGVNPNLEIKKNDNFTFDELALKFFEFKSIDLSEDYIKKQKSRYNYFVKPMLGGMVAEDITKKDIIDTINNIPNANTRSTKKTDLRETKRIVLLLISSIFKYSNSNDLLKNNAYLTIDPKVLVPKRSDNHFKSITNETEFKKLYKMLYDYVGDVSTKYALLFLVHTALRSHNVRFLKWDNIDFEKRVIEFSKDEMKAREVFRLPLTETTYEILQEVKKYNSGYKYVFSSVLSKNKMLSENTLGYALKRMGITEHTPHGFRSSFSTICYENHKLHGFSSEVIETQLAHSVGSKVKLAYLRSDFLQERRELLKWWDEWLMH